MLCYAVPYNVHRISAVVCVKWTQSPHQLKWMKCIYNDIINGFQSCPIFFVAVDFKTKTARDQPHTHFSILSSFNHLIHLAWRCAKTATTLRTIDSVNEIKETVFEGQSHLMTIIFSSWKSSTAIKCGRHIVPYAVLPLMVCDSSGRAIQYEQRSSNRFCGGRDFA